ncbi:MAG: efflux RND transporter permease subunit, partial [Bdellovibrionaceae bacterium]|nr:efflux RND transporter permease subunit [Pseudobdellovibrionaceae bacterium]
VAISGDENPLRLREIARELEKRLESVPGVAKVVFRGLRDLEIRVNVDPQKLQARGLTLDDVINSLRSQNRSVPGGTITPVQGLGGGGEKIVRTVSELKTPQDVANAVIRANESGLTFRVRDVATVEYDLERPTVLNRVNGRPSISLTVLKKEKADAIRLVEDVKKATAEFASEHKGLFTDFINDLSLLVKRRLGVLSSNMLVGLVLIAVILTLFLPGRIALVVISGVILSFFGTMIIFHNFLGTSLNLISLMGLIIVSGMLVDDAIVASDNIARLRDEGLDRERAAIDGAHQIAAPITASVLTTVLAFAPMLFMSGIFGKFIAFIPTGVIVALLFSLFESLIILPGHMAHYVHSMHLEPRGPWSRFKLAFLRFWDNEVTERYTRIVEILVRRRYTVAISSLGFVILTGIIAASTLKFILFPPGGIDTFFIRAKIPTGASLDETAAAMEPIEKAIMELPKEELKNFATTIGLIQQDANDPNSKRGTEYAQIAVYLTPETDRVRSADEIIEDLRQKIGKPEIFEQLTFQKVAGGPPVGRPISLSVQGKEYEQILAAVADLKKVVAEIPGVFDVQDSYIPGKEELQVRIDMVKATMAGLNIASIGQTIRAAIDGVVATSVQLLDDEVDIRVIFNSEARQNEKVLGKIQLANLRGNLVPLENIARIVRTKDITTYEHQNNNREIKVTADVDTKVTSSRNANNAIRKILPDFNRKYPELKVVFGGEDEDTQESLASLARAFAVAFLGILFVLILTFKSLLQPLLVAGTIPMGIIAVLWAFVILRMPLSFLAMIGIIALAGVVVNNAIVLIDYTNKLREQGMQKVPSILLAARTRLRPIFLTSFTTVAGLLPTAHGIGGIDRFVVPIAVALGYGLLIGSIMTLFFFPPAIAMLDDLTVWVSRLWNRRKAATAPTASHG